MVIKSYHIILAVKILGWFLLKWAGFGELLGWKSSTHLATLINALLTDTHTHTHTHTHAHTHTHTLSLSLSLTHKQTLTLSLSLSLSLTHTHTHTHVGFYGLRGLSISVMVFILYKLYVLLPYTYPTPKLSPHRRLCTSTPPPPKKLTLYDL